ncbi:GNAT family N-acetyltransferase [Paenibacillus ehimensis]|uniref:GNAT family N-acetyltransferase n=1 Tax=Paenibacillus ehimensis TaxID=79264 RepID=A0ABT8V737_9BACL|nr:GNAT family N-acetyltransferase [Paenibacillus ehimensis]MDO3676548.1 GNAT family N-acetyltransferase [Paenibacillus ehimensis]
MNYHLERVYSGSDEYGFVRNQLLAYNLKNVDASFEFINFVVKNGSQETIGGLFSRRFGEGIFIEMLWVDEGSRKLGLGSRLLQEIEQAGRRQDVKFIYLDTFSFQAPDFYSKHGFEVFGTLEDFPVQGCKKYFLKKTL